MKKRTISMLLVLLMVLSTASTCVFAVGETEEPQTDSGAAITQEDIDLVDGTSSDAKNEGEGTENEGNTEVPSFDVVSVEKNGQNGATITWETDADETYKVNVTPVTGGTEGAAQKFDATAGTAEVKGLAAGTKYTFKVSLVDAEGTEKVLIETSEIETDPAPIVPDKPQIATYSAYNSVAVEWSPVKNASYYNVYKDGVRVQSRVTSRSVFDPNLFSCVCYGVNDDGNHRFQVEAVSAEGNAVKSNAVIDNRVRRMYINITFKQKKTLKSHDGTNTKYTFKKGQSVQAFGFGSGQYYFTYPVNGRDRTFYVNYGRVRKPSAVYTRSFDYSEREAEYFVRTTGKGSSTSRLIWANLYTQHIYLFNNVNGVWRLNGGTYSHWECSSGKASSPSPTGLSFTIKNKYKRHSSTRFWNTYKGQAAIHGQVNNSYGRPLSHGCIRNPNAKAEFIFKYYPKKTRVMVY